jgi:WD40 repeat protein
VVAGWLHGVAYRVSLSARRDANRRRARETRERPARAPSPPGPSDEMAWRETQAIVDAELQRLPERLRTPVILCCLEGLGHAEAARRLGWKTGTVSSRLHEARKRLSRCLERRGLSLSAVPGGLTVADGVARTALPPARTSETVAVALRFVNGGAAGSAGKLATLALREVLWTRVWVAAMVTGAAAVAGVFMIVPGMGVRSAPAPIPAPEPVAVPITALAEANRGRLDRLGDLSADVAISRPETDPIRHDFSIESVVWSPGGRVIASLGGGGDDARTISLWDPFTGRILHQLAAKEAVRAVAFSADGKTLAAAEGPRGIVLWEVGSGKERVRITGRGDSLAVAFAPDGRTLAAVDRTGVIQIWEVPNRRLVVELKASTHQSVTKVAYAPDGKTLASTGDDGAVILWDLSTGTERWWRKPNPHRLNGVAFAPDGKTFATTGADGTIRVWDPSSGEALRAFGGAANGYVDDEVPIGTLLAYSPDGRTLVQGFGSIISTWDSTGKSLWGRPTTGKLRSLAYSPDGRVLATTVSGDAGVQLWNPADMSSELYSAVGNSAKIHGLGFSPDGKTLWSAARYKGVYCCDVASGKGQQLPGVHADGYFHPNAFSKDGRKVASGGRDGSIGLWDTDGRPLATLTGHTGDVLAVAFSPNGETLASSGADHTVRFWDLVTNRQLRQAQMPDRTWGCLAFSPDSRKLALARGEEFSRLPFAPVVLDVLTCKEVFRLESPSPDPDASEASSASPGSKEFVTFSPDGRTLATSGRYQDSFARLWDAATGELTGRCAGEYREHWPCHLSFSPDGRLLATGPDCITNMVFLWELATCQEVGTLTGIQGGTTALAFSPDGRSLASGGSGGTVRVFDVTCPGRACDARLALARDLTGRASSEDRRLPWLMNLQLEDCWKLLRGKNGREAKVAYKAVRAMANDPVRSVPFLAERLRPQAPSDPNEPVLFERLRQRRAVMALEYCATREARQVLQELATAEVTTPLAREARAALDRLNSQQ